MDKKIKKAGKLILRAKIRKDKTNGLVLYMKISPALELFFKNRQTLPQATDEYGNLMNERNEQQDNNTSSHWKDILEGNLKYYKRGDSRDLFNQLTSDLNISLSDNYGGSLYDCGRVNIGILRTIGLSNGKNISVDENISLIGLKKYCDALAKCCKFIYSEFIEPITINIEVRTK